MWITPLVELPDALVEAQRRGRLVVFAGAGVSMGTPSSLPDFDALADQVSGGALAREPHEQVDHYLGRLDSAGVKVQLRTRELIDRPGSSPTSLHRSLLRLFGSASDVRLVTTNFDRHFTSAATELFADGVEEYVAPALPLGGDFAGIVYLHGSVSKPRRELVLTDADFGRAYLRDAWATRMLVDMFSEYSVLFVGYSHEDVVMRYLARSLIKGTDRYVFTLPGAESKWESLGIRPVTHPVSPGESAFQELDNALEAWANRIAMGSLDHKQRLEEIAAGAPPVDAITGDYVRAAFKEVNGFQFFSAKATSPEWLLWAEKQGLLAPLFRRDGQLSEVELRIAAWFVDTFTVDHHDTSLAVVQRGGTHLHPACSGLLLWRIGSGKPAVSPRVAAVWLAIATCAGTSFRNPTVELGLLRFIDGESWLPATLIFRSLSEPSLHLEAPWRFDDDQREQFPIRAEVRFAGEGHWAGEFLEKVKIGGMAQVAEPLAQIAAATLSHVHYLLRATEQAGGIWDPTSYSRSAIEPHPQDVFREWTDFAVDAARNSLAWMIAHNRPQGLALMQYWCCSAVPLLRRIGINAMRGVASEDAEGVIDAIVRNKWLFEFGLKQEVFSLLRESFPCSGPATRARLIEYAGATSAAAARPDEEDEDQEVTRRYELYNVAVWLAQVAPESPEAAAFLSEQQAKNPTFVPREHPDFDSYSDGVRSVWPISPRSVEELLDGPPGPQLEYLLSYATVTRMGEGPDRSGLLIAVRDACGRDRTWSLALATELSRRDKWDSDLWPALLGGWAVKWSATPERPTALAFLEGAVRRPQWFPREVVDVLEALLDLEEGERLSPAELDSCERLAWQYAEQAPEMELEADVHSDWLTTAINHPSGRAVIVLVKALSERVRRRGTDEKGLPSPFGIRLSGLLNSEVSSIRSAASIVLPSQIHFLHSLDPLWTVTNLVPRFDWRTRPLEAVQAWHGFLSWGRWNDALFAAMREHTIAAFDRLDTELAMQRQGLAKRLSAMAVFSSIEPLADGWLKEFLRHAGVTSRVAWTRAVGGLVSELGPDAVVAVWDRWMSRYWRERLTGVPLAFDPMEVLPTAEWLFGLEPALPQVVDYIERGPPLPVNQGLFLYRLQESDLPQKHPAEIARVLLVVVRGATSLSYECGQAETLGTSLIEAGAPKTLMMPVCDELARVGCAGASALRARLP